METYEEEQTDHGRAFQYERRQGNDVAGYENGEVNDHGAHKRHQLDRHTFKLETTSSESRYHTKSTYKIRLSSSDLISSR